MDLLLSTITFLIQVWMVFLLVPLPYSNFAQKSPSENLLLWGQHGPMRVESDHYFAYASRNPQLPDQPIFQDIAALHTHRLIYRQRGSSTTRHFPWKQWGSLSPLTRNTKPSGTENIPGNSSWTALGSVSIWVAIYYGQYHRSLEESTQHSSRLGLSVTW